ncbi:hypothetical protein BDM02DRAFT_3110010 [Thelephora ganbajun]|uniref:Uncharacterized protein n=1 Tax=Thelephora ganbajun TaxID=370292 RepID=A0ACB6ZQT8_THEGA|nr:hypothetical protein BDM02DRAFT_3110010 [Thelephora ganbajun]
MEPTTSTALSATTPIASPSKSTLAPNRKGGPKVDVFLASLQTAGSQPSLEDLERRRPREYAHPESTLYAKQYNEVMGHLDRSFTKEQLRQFGEKYQLDPRLWRSHRRKVDYARAIVENAWGWPSLRDIEKRKREKTEVVTEMFNVSRSQLFLILGKDGSDLLQLANDFSVRISTIPKPLALKVQGLRSSLKQVSERIGTLKRSIVEEMVRYDGSEPLSKGYIEKISRLSSAFVESFGDQLRICAADSRNLSAAKRLINRATHHLRERPKLPLLSHIPPPPTSSFGYSAEEEVYSMYPFVPHTPLPWTMGDSSVFRIRKLSDWLTQNSTIGVVVTGVLNSGSVVNTSREPIDLRGALLDSLPGESPNRIRTCTASIGHILFSHSDGQKTTLAPPMKGHGPYSKILNWIQSERPRSEFVPSVPPSLATPSEPRFRNLHRLTYRASGTLTLPSSSPRVLKLEIPLELRDVGSDANVTNTTMEHILQTSGMPRMWMGCQSEVDMLMPHRPVDMRLSIQDFSLAPETTLPLVLQQYVAELDSYLQSQKFGKMEQPAPPTSFLFQGIDYELHLTGSVRRNINPSSTDKLGGVVTETILDLETSQRSSVCLVNGGNPMVDVEWNEFLSQCDKMTTFQHRPTNSLILDDLDANDINTTR